MSRFEFLDTITVVEITSEIKQTTIDLRGNNRFKLPDAIIAATAKSLGAILLTLIEIDIKSIRKF